MPLVNVEKLEVSCPLLARYNLKQPFSWPGFFSLPKLLPLLSNMWHLRELVLHWHPRHNGSALAIP
jgi:hypothetical protein